MSRPRYYIHKYVSFERCETGWGAFDADENKFVSASSVHGICLWKEAIDAQMFSNYLNYQEFLKNNLENERIHDINQIGGLQEENARLKAEVERLASTSTNADKFLISGLEQEVAILKAENERLRASSFVTAVPVEHYERLLKAGDAMAVCITEFRCGKYGNALDKVGGFKVWNAWNAAKEGKPTETKSPSFIEDLGNGVEKHDLLFRYPAKEGKPSV